MFRPKEIGQMWGKGRKAAKFYLLSDRIRQKKLEKANAYSKPRGKPKGVWVRSLGAEPSLTLVFQSSRTVCQGQGLRDSGLPQCKQRQAASRVLSSVLKWHSLAPGTGRRG